MRTDNAFSRKRTGSGNAGDHGAAVAGFLVFFLFMTALVTRNGDPAWMALPFLAYLCAGILQSPAAGSLNVKTVRTVNRTVESGSVVIHVSIAIRNQGRTVMFFRAADPLPEGTKMTEGSLSLTAALMPGTGTVLRYSFRAARGNYSWKTLRLIAGDPFELTGTVVEAAASACTVVQPVLRKMRPIRLHPWNTLSSAGTIRTRRGGTGTDFFGIRDYRPGDPLRTLDRRLTSRHPHKLFTREFVLEKTARIALILDARPKTELIAGTESLFEHEIEAVASLAEMFLRQGHCVSLLTYGSAIGTVYPDYGRIQLNRILNCLAGADAGNDDAHGSLNGISMHRIQRNALVIVVSPIEAYDITFFRRLRASGYQVILISPDTFDFAGPVLKPDEPTRLALDICRLERRVALKSISRLYIPVIDWPVHEPLQPLVRNALGHPLRAPVRR